MHWGIPLLVTSVDYDENDEKILKDFLNRELKCWIKQVVKTLIHMTINRRREYDIHEMGGCRMGKDPKTSLLNKWNQFHNCTECICNGWRLYDKYRYTKPIAHIYGNDSKSCDHAVNGIEKRKLIII